MKTTSIENSHNELLTMLHKESDYWRSKKNQTTDEDFEAFRRGKFLELNDEEFWTYKAKHEIFDDAYSLIKKIKIHSNDNIDDYYFKVIDKVKSEKHELGYYGNWSNFINDICLRFVIDKIYNIIPDKYLNRALIKYHLRRTYKIFLSFSSSDRSIVNEIGSYLERSGIVIWYDQNDIVIGDKIQTKISQGIDESEFFCIFLSEISIQSKWVQFELQKAIHRNNSKKISILPIKIGDCEIPNQLQGVLCGEVPAEINTTSINHIVFQILETIDSRIRKLL